MKYTLIDGVQRHQSSPQTFGIPSNLEKDVLRPGAFVKVGVEFNPPLGQINAERFWVLIIEKKDDKLIGVIDNDLVATERHGLALGQALSFETRHILSIE